MIRKMALSLTLAVVCWANVAHSETKNSSTAPPVAQSKVKPDKNKWSLSRRTGDYANALRLSNEAISVLSAAASAPLPDNAPNDAVMIYLAKQQPENVRQKAIATATATALIMTSDRICEIYMADFLLKSRSVSGGLRLGSLAFSTAAGVSTPVRSANVLSAISSLMSGSEEKLTETVLGKKAPELIYRSVMSIRTRERTRLLILLGSADLNESASGIVLSQISDYHNQCGPTVGINGFEQAVQASANTAATEGKTDAEAFVRQTLDSTGSN